MAGILNTNGASIARSATQFESFDVIRHSAGSKAPVNLIVTSGQVLDLSSELGSIGADILAVNGPSITLTSGGGNDELTTGNGNDTLIGRAGNDVLFGGGGDDRLFGDAGNDVFALYGPSGTDVFRGGSGVDTLLLRGSISLTRLTLDAAASTERLDLNTHTLSGSAGVDIFNFAGLTSYVRGNTIDLGGGNDVFKGSSRNDHMIGGAGNDRLVASAGNDRIEGGLGNDALFGDAGDDAFVLRTVTGAGVDLYRGGIGTDTLLLETDAQLSRLTLDAAASVERIDTSIRVLKGTNSVDVFNLSGVNTYVKGNFISLGGGNDVFVGARAADNVSGDAGNDNLETGLGNDRLDGGLGNDRLSGGAGNDYLDGWAGNDIIAGGAGSDVIVFSSPLTANIDRVVGFEVGIDTMLLHMAVFKGLFANPNAAKFAIGPTATTFDHRIIYNAATGALYYDSDGSGNRPQQQFATLDTNLALTHDDFSLL